MSRRARPLTSEVVSESLLALLDDGQPHPETSFAGLRIHLDWIQYKQNFREAVTVMQSADGRGLGPLMEARIDSRQVTPGSVREAMERAIRYADPEHAEKPERIYLEEFRSFRASIAWGIQSTLLAASEGLGTCYREELRASPAKRKIGR